MSDISGVHPYYEPGSDMTSKAYISWIDNTDNPGEGFDFRYREEGESEFEDVEIFDEDDVPPVDFYRYTVVLDNLDSKTVYEAEIEDSQGNIQDIKFETLPRRLWKSEIRFCVISDTHLDDNVISEEAMDDIAEHDPEVFLVCGDLVDRADQYNYPEESKANSWLDWWRDYYTRVLPEDNFLIPFIMVNGNHDADVEWSLSGQDRDIIYDEEEVDEDNGYLKHFAVGLREEPPQGLNYADFKAGNSVQFTSIDTFTRTADNIAEWMEENDIIDRDRVVTSIPLSHQPVLAGAERRDADDEMQMFIREEWGWRLDVDSVVVKFNGHIHIEKITKHWKVVEEEPDSGDYTDIGNGRYIKENPEQNGVIEFGSGYRSGRDLIDEWWLKSNTDDHSVAFKGWVDENEVEVEVVRYGASNSTFTFDTHNFVKNYNTNMFAGGV